MASFLVWNTRNNNLDSLVHNLVIQKNIDVVLLVEYAFGLSQLPALLQQNGLTKRNKDGKFGVFARANHGMSLLRYRLGKRAKLWQWTSPGGQDGTIALIHGHDRRNYDDSTRRSFFRQVADAIRTRESRVGHRRSIVVGDFNAQPFDSSVVSTDGLHAIGVTGIGKQTARKIHGRRDTVDFFYNPMWRLYGHGNAADAGAATHYWLGSWPYDLAWHMLDQVVVRPEESPNFPANQLQIVTSVGGISLLDGMGKRKSKTTSDHLPIVFHWNL